MNNIINNIKSLASIKYFIGGYVFIFIVSLFYGKIAGLYYEKSIKKILISRFQITNELINGLIVDAKVKFKWKEYMNCFGKALMYLSMGLASLGQLLIIMIQKSVDLVSANVCMLTMTISFLEFRDNISTSRRMKKECDIEISNIIDASLDVERMALDDFVLENMVKENQINDEKRMDMIKEISRDRSK